MSEHVQIDCTSGMASVSDEPGPDQQAAMVAAETGLTERAQQERTAEARQQALARLRRLAELPVLDGGYLPLTTYDLKDLLLVIAGEP
jgi:hypothetical protein